MEFIGFFTEHDKACIYSKALENQLLTVSFDKKEREKIINYLSNGVFVFGWMGYEKDKEGNLIIPLGYYTDGIWIWPGYYIYYLKKYENMKIQDNFIQYVQKNNYVNPKVSKEQVSNAESTYYLSLN